MLEEDRIISIETKIAFHEDLVQTLDNAVYEQQQRISALEAQLKDLVQRMTDVPQVSGEGDELPERPPHY